MGWKVGKMKLLIRRNKGMEKAKDGENKDGIASKQASKHMATPVKQELVTCIRRLVSGWSGFFPINSTPVSMLSLLFLSLHLLIANAGAIPKHHVVYMGSLPNGHGRGAGAELSYLQLLSAVIPSQENDRISLIHHYRHAFSGFSAMLTQDEALLLSGFYSPTLRLCILFFCFLCFCGLAFVVVGKKEYPASLNEISKSGKEGVVSVFQDTLLQLHTTRSWDFLDSLSPSSRRRNPPPPPPLSSTSHYNLSSDVIIGIIDSGIWPESPSFNDHGVGEIPATWKGVCMQAPGFRCNRKLIGARYYTAQPMLRSSSSSNSHKAPPISGSPRDSMGHGTHTASIAGGSPVPQASYHGLAKGTARGGSPSSRIASYKACDGEGCSSSAVLKAIDDAVGDGVDIISISVGSSSIFQPDYINDPIAIGAFHAHERGLMVVASAGNEGPFSYTVVNSAPWIFTVAASNIDRNFESLVVLGNGTTFPGSAINFSNLTRSETYPLVFGEDAATGFTPVSEARNCYPGSLDRKKVEGKIVVCVDEFSSASRRIKKLVVEDARAKGMILIDETAKDVPFDSGVFPFTQVGNSAGFHILNYINSTKKPRATILPTVEVPKFKPAPVVASFSSRGPSSLTENILKPDIMAPGVAILGAMIPTNDRGTTPPGKRGSSRFEIGSGTSMACPHVTGAAAFVKSVHTGWTSSIIKSALMTTATLHNNLGKSVTNTTNYPANAHEMGVGEINPHRALDPGLVFETTTNDYLGFLCYYGYPKKIIKSLSKKNFSCPRVSKEELISGMNYPSISIGKLDRKEGAKVVKRTVTNVGTSNCTYISKVEAPLGLAVKIWPRKIAFSEKIRKVSFRVWFQAKAALAGSNYGAITWLDGKHSVRLVFAVNVE